MGPRPSSLGSFGAKGIPTSQSSRETKQLYGKVIFSDGVKIKQ